MSRERDVFDHLQDILSSIDHIGKFTAGMTYAEFSSDDKTVFAVVRGIEIIGEATKRIGPDFRERNHAIPWRDMAGMRDVLIHSYERVDLRVVWRTAMRDLPRIRPLLAALYELEGDRESRDL